jgi:protein-tyrosine phosphatase
MAMESTVVHVEIERVERADALTVWWEFAGEPFAVDVALGTSPDHVDHERQATVAAGESSVQLRRKSGGRMFVSVAPHEGGPALVAAERRIPFEAVTNFRDLGGYPTRSGHRVRWGRLFRSDALHGMTEGDLAMYNELGLRAVYDLRGDVEIAERPNPMPSRRLPIVTSAADADTSVAFEGTTNADGERVLANVYVAIIEHAATQIGELFSALAEPDGLPAVFHCHAGKDRTGLVAALLLEVLGVERESILDDYELTGRYRLRAQQDESFERMLNAGLAPEAAAGVLTAPRWAMAAALDHLDREYRTAESYLTGPAAMTMPALQRLKDQLLSP